MKLPPRTCTRARWRKYGQKDIKGSPHPRSYYRCSTTSCSARKYVDPLSGGRNVITYEHAHSCGADAAIATADDGGDGLIGIDVEEAEVAGSEAEVEEVAVETWPRAGGIALELHRCRSAAPRPHRSLGAAEAVATYPGYCAALGAAPLVTLTAARTQH